MPRSPRSTKASRAAGPKARKRRALLVGSETMGDRYPVAASGTAGDRKFPSNGVRTVRNAMIALGVARQGGSKQAAADACEISRTSFHQWLKEDDEFRAAWEDAVEGGTDSLEDEVVRRGARGYRKGIWHNGKRVGYERVYSDSLLTAALGSRRPATWAKKDGGVNVQVNTVNNHLHLSLEDLRREAEQRGLPMRIFEE